MAVSFAQLWLEQMLAVGISNLLPPEIQRNSTKPSAKILLKNYLP